MTGDRPGSGQSDLLPTPFTAAEIRSALRVFAAGSSVPGCNSGYEIPIGRTAAGPSPEREPDQSDPVHARAICSAVNGSFTDQMIFQESHGCQSARRRQSRYCRPAPPESSPSTKGAFASGASNTRYRRHGVASRRDRQPEIGVQRENGGVLSMGAAMRALPGWAPEGGDAFSHVCRNSDATSQGCPPACREFASTTYLPTQC
jgi:hypothetical protein